MCGQARKPAETAGISTENSDAFLKIGKEKKEWPRLKMGGPVNESEGKKND
jgi:hypothetical protein